MMKRIFILIISLAFLFCLAGDVFAEEITSEISALPDEAIAENRVLITDRAGLLSEYDKGLLTEQAKTITGRFGFDVIILTADDTGGKSTQVYAEDYAAELIEQGYSKDMFLYFIDMDERMPYIVTSGLAIKIFSDYSIEYIHDCSYSYLAEAEYSGAVIAVLIEAERQALLYTGGAPGDVYYPDDGYWYPENNYTYFSFSTSEAFGAALVIALLVAGGTVYFVYRRYKTVGVTAGLPYNMNRSLNLRNSEDLLIHRNVTSRHIPKDPPPNHSNHSSGGSSHSGGGSSHSHSSGNTFGGGGGKHF